MYKKAQSRISLGMLATIIILITVAGLLATFSNQITQDVRSDQAAELTTTITYINETVTANGTLIHAGTPTLTSAIDNTTLIVANSTNSSMGSFNGWALIEETGVFYRTFTSTGDVVNVTYTATRVELSEAYNVSTNIQIGSENLTDQLGNAGTVVGAAVIIGILLTAFVIKMGGVNFTR